MWRTGHRLGEAVKTSDEHFVRADVTYRIAGRVVVDPTPEDLQQLSTGDVVYLAPARSKTDFSGVMYSPFPSILPFRPDDATNAAQALCALEKAD
eukprot:3349287-Pleurochrysis_carterae.AAC.1